MTPADETEAPGLSPELAIALARRLRHEVGDFLQKVYATVAILQGRLPAQYQQERDLLLRMRRQGESCKELLDSVQDFLCPIHLNLEPLDVAALTMELVRDAQPRWPALEIRCEGSGPATVLADFERIAQVGKMLLANACEAARQRVTLRTVSVPETRIVEWTIRDDGPGASTEHLGQLFTPFFSTRPGHGGLGLSLARKLILLHRGQITTENLTEGGFQVVVRLPQELEAAVN